MQVLGTNSGMPMKNEYSWQSDAQRLWFVTQGLERLSCGEVAPLNLSCVYTDNSRSQTPLPCTSHQYKRKHITAKEKTIRRRKAHDAHTRVVWINQPDKPTGEAWPLDVKGRVANLNRGNPAVSLCELAALP